MNVSRAAVTYGLYVQPVEVPLRRLEQVLISV